MKLPFIKPRIFILLIVFIGLLLYAKGLTNNFVGDDKLQILNNTKVHSIYNIPSFFAGSTYENGGADYIAGIFYRPVMMSAFSIIYLFSGNDPLLYHLVQLLLHIANTILLFIFLRRFFPNILSFIISIFFLIHPVNSETVLYSANLQEVLFFFFGMISLILLGKKGSSKLNLYLIPLMILLSLFSKESAVLFIFVLLIYTFLFDKDRSRFKFLMITLPFTFGVYLFFRYIVAHLLDANNSLAPITHASLLIRIINIPSIIFYYLRLFFYPVVMSSYQFWIVKTTSLSDFWLPLLIILSFFVLMILGFVWTNKKHKKNTKLYLFFMLWFIIGLSLHLQILPLDATVADRWFYFPIVGILAILALILSQINLNKIKHLSKILTIGIFIVIILLATRTYIRISDWKNDLSLFEPHIHSTTDFISENSYGAALINNGQFEKAKPHVIESIAIHPFSVNLNNLAIIYASEGNKIKAKQYFEEAINIGQNISVYENYANYLLYYESAQDALNFSQQAIKIYPQSAKLYLILSKAEYLQNNKTQALIDAVKSYKIEPDEKTADIILTEQNNKPLNLKHQ